MNSRLPIHSPLVAGGMVSVPSSGFSESSPDTVFNSGLMEINPVLISFMMSCARLDPRNITSPFCVWQKVTG
jgi:hypothetical protein